MRDVTVKVVPMATNRVRDLGLSPDGIHGVNRVVFNNAHHRVLEIVSDPKTGQSKVSLTEEPRDLFAFGRVGY